MNFEGHSDCEMLTLTGRAASRVPVTPPTPPMPAGHAGHAAGQQAEVDEAIRSTSVFHVCAMGISCSFHLSVRFMGIPCISCAFRSYVSHVYSMCIPCLVHVYSMYVSCVLHVYTMCFPYVCHVYSMCLPCVFHMCATCKLVCCSGHWFISATHYVHELLKCLFCQGADAAASPQEVGLAGCGVGLGRGHGRHGETAV